MLDRLSRAVVLTLHNYSVGDPTGHYGVQSEYELTTEDPWAAQACPK